MTQEPSSWLTPYEHLATATHSRLMEPAPTLDGVSLTLFQLRLALASLEALSSFGGVGRRFEERGQVENVTFIDDYAHLPTEVEAALAAAKSLDRGRVIAAFQPHRYSRTEQLWSTFGNSFSDADVLFVTGIYPSGETPRPGITGRLIVDVISQHNPAMDVRYYEQLDELTDSRNCER